MVVQTLKLGGKRYVVLPEQEYQRLTKPAARGSLEDERDAARLRRRLAAMKRRGEKPVPYARARLELGLP